MTCTAEGLTVFFLGDQAYVLGDQAETRAAGPPGMLLAPVQFLTSSRRDT